MQSKIENADASPVAQSALATSSDADQGRSIGMKELSDSLGQMKATVEKLGWEMQQGQNQSQNRLRSIESMLQELLFSQRQKDAAAALEKPNVTVNLMNQQSAQPPRAMTPPPQPHPGPTPQKGDMTIADIESGFNNGGKRDGPDSFVPLQAPSPEGKTGKICTPNKFRSCGLGGR
jgi:hypothetical protein